MCDEKEETPYPHYEEFVPEYDAEHALSIDEKKETPSPYWEQANVNRSDVVYAKRIMSWAMIATVIGGVGRVAGYVIIIWAAWRVAQSLSR